MSPVSGLPRPFAGDTRALVSRASGHTSPARLLGASLVAAMSEWDKGLWGLFCRKED